MESIPPADIDQIGAWEAPDIGRRAALSRWATIGAVAALLFVTFAVFRSRDFADYSVDWQIMLKGGTWLAAGAVGVFSMGGQSVRPVGAPLVAGFGLFLFFSISALWSPTPEYTIATAGCALSVFLFAIGVGSRLSEHDLLIAGWIAASSLAGSSLVLYAIASGDIGAGENDRFAGFTNHATALATVASYLILVSALLLPSAGRQIGISMLLVGSIALGLVTTVLTESRMPLGAVVLASALYALLRNQSLRALSPLVSILVLACAVVASAVGLDALVSEKVVSLVSRSGQVEEVLTVTGRLEIWSYVLEHISEAPVFGHGFGSSRAVLSTFSGWSISHTHNILLQALLEGGVIGVALLLAVFYFQTLELFARPAALRDIVFLSSVILGVTEISIMDTTPAVMWILTLALYGRRSDLSFPLSGPLTSLDEPGRSRVPDRI